MLIKDVQRTKCLKATVTDTFESRLTVSDISGGLQTKNH